MWAEVHVVYRHRNDASPIGRPTTKNNQRHRGRDQERAVRQTNHPRPCMRQTLGITGGEGRRPGRNSTSRPRGSAAPARPITLDGLSPCCSPAAAVDGGALVTEFDVTSWTHQSGKGPRPPCSSADASRRASRGTVEINQRRDRSVRVVLGESGSRDRREQAGRAFDDHRQTGHICRPRPT